MSEPKVPVGTFRFEVRSVPTTKEDINLIAWAITGGSLWLEDTGEAPAQAALVETRFNLPYNQGGGLVYVEKVSEEDFRKYLADYERTPESGTYTGWFIKDNYTDSMTSPFRSPVYRTEDPEFPFITEDY